jgi:molecular chaperone GrpE
MDMIDEDMMKEDERSEQDPLEEAGPASSADDDLVSILKKERDEYLCGWRRAKADYENLVKETQRSKEEYVKYANEQALLRLLPAIDQYDVALSFVPDMDAIPAESRRPFENWLMGLEAVRSLWIEAAKELGLEKVRVSGSFNPSIHEAVGEEKSESVSSGEIVRATVNGWMLNGKLIRPAKVIVSA